MKKLIVIPLLLTSLIYSKTSDLPYKEVFQSPIAFIKALGHATNLYFKGAHSKDYDIQDLGDRLFEKIVFDYHLALQCVISKKIPSTSYTIYFHGWGDTKNSSLLVKEFTKTIDDNLIYFNFPDAQPIIGKLNKSSFGQLNDMLPAIYALKRAIEILKLETINIFGMSRGCAVLINILALLNDDRLFNKYKPELSLIGVSHQIRMHILHVIQRGTIILDVPLRSIQLTRFPKALIKHLTIHDAHVWDPLIMVHYLKGLKLNILIHYQYGDKVVSNKQEAQFFSDLALCNDAPSTYLVMGNDGGHVHSHKSLYAALPIFKYMYQEQIYHHTSLKIAHGNELIENGQLVRFEQPSIQVIDKVLKRYYQSQKK